MRNNELILVYETQYENNSIICEDIKMLQKEITDLYLFNDELKFYVTYRSQVIPTIDSESKFKGYDKEREYINAYCDMTDSIMNMEGK